MQFLASVATKAKNLEQSYNSKVAMNFKTQTIFLKEKTDALNAVASKTTSLTKLSCYETGSSCCHNTVSAQAKKMFCSEYFRRLR